MSIGQHSFPAAAWQAHRSASRPLPASRSDTLAGVAACALLFAALLLGGGTRNHLFSDLAVQLLSVGVLVYALRRLRWQEIERSGRQLLVLSLLVLALPLLQWIPLPQALSAAAPGRAEIWSQHTALGLETPMLVPWSLDANGTLAALRGLLPAAAMALVAVQLGTLWQRRLVLIVIAVALLMVPIGIAQVAQGPHSALRPYVPTNVHDAVGLFANRNHYAGLLAVALALVLGAMTLDARRLQQRSARVLRMLGWLLVGSMLLLGVVLSRSRAGVGLAGLVILAMLMLAFTRRRTHPQVFHWLLAFTVVGGLIAFQYGFLGIADRLLQQGDQRFDVNASVLAVAGQFGWLGTGLGSFPAVYAAHEPIDLVGPKILNHAHNDWAELCVELGVLLIVVTFAFGRWLWQRVRELAASGTLTPAENALRLAGIGVILVLATHSLVDYPLRTTALSVVFALACALCTRPLGRASARRDDS